MAILKINFESAALGKSTHINLILNMAATPPYPVVYLYARPVARRIELGAPDVDRTVRRILPVSARDARWRHELVQRFAPRRLRDVHRV